MEPSEEHYNKISLSICEVEGIVDVLIFIEQEAEPPQRQRLNDGMLTLLHVATERLQRASENLTKLKAAA